MKALQVQSEVTWGAVVDRVCARARARVRADAVCAWGTGWAVLVRFSGGCLHVCRRCRCCWQVLKGVGAKLAERIVEYREKQTELSGMSAFAEVFVVYKLLFLLFTSFC
jgi:hypothetical protein